MCFDETRILCRSLYIVSEIIDGSGEDILLLGFLTICCRRLFGEYQNDISIFINLVYSVAHFGYYGG
jgi:hypothetical protein